MTPAPTYSFTDACTACGACLLTCPEHAIVAGLPLQVREDRCTACGECVEVCPADAVVERAGASTGRDHGVGAHSLSVASGHELHGRGGDESGDERGDGARS